MSIAWLTGEQLYSPAVWAQLVRATNNRRTAMGYAPLTVAGYASGSLPDYPTSADVSGIRQDLRGLKHFTTQLATAATGPRVTASGTLTWMQAGYASAITFEALPSVNKTDDFGPWIAAYRRNIDLMERVGFTGGIAGAGQDYDMAYGSGSPFSMPAEGDTSGQIARFGAQNAVRAYVRQITVGFRYAHSFDPDFGGLSREWALDGNIIWDTEELDWAILWDALSTPTADVYLAFYIRDAASTPATKYTAPPTPYVQRIWEHSDTLTGTDGDDATGTVTLDSAVKELDAVNLWGFAKYDPGAITDSAYPSMYSYISCGEFSADIRLNYRTDPLDADGEFT